MSEFEFWLFGVGGIAGLVVLALWGWLRPGRSKAEVRARRRRERNGVLPFDPAIRAELLRRDLIRSDATARGMAIGAVIGLAVHVPATMAGYPGVGFVLTFWCLAISQVLATARGQRVALAVEGRVRETSHRGRDDLRRIELVCRWILIVIAAWQIVAGAIGVALGREARQTGLTLALVSAACLVVCWLVVSAERRIVRLAPLIELPQPWERIDRTAVVRDAASGLVGAAYLQVMVANEAVSPWDDTPSWWFLLAAGPILPTAAVALTLGIADFSERSRLRLLTLARPQY